MLVLFDFEADAPRVLLIIPRLDLHISCADMLDATWTAADHLLQRGYVEQAETMMRPFQQALKVLA